MPLPLVETGISVKAGSCFFLLLLRLQVPLADSFLFILAAKKKLQHSFSLLRFGASRTRFGLFAPLLHSSTLALVTSLLFRSRLASSTSLPLAGGRFSDIAFLFTLFSLILGISDLFRWHPRHLIFVSRLGSKKQPSTPCLVMSGGWYCSLVGEEEVWLQVEGTNEVTREMERCIATWAEVFYLLLRSGYVSLPLAGRPRADLFKVPKMPEKDGNAMIRTGASSFLPRAKRTTTAGSDVVQSGRPIFDDFFQHLWPYIGNNTANVVFQMVKRLWLIRIDQ
ncbi:hypothetical protein TNCV_2810491 [Trichonephila clavipes]|nr:hypothetical protein TNCV_2810491 [Trichonephila clavipes]